MADNAPPRPAVAGSGAGPAGDAAAGLPFYEKQRQHLKELIAKRRALEKRLAAQEEAIYQKESEYLENTPSGNIITGFDNYIKGLTGAAAQRRKTGVTEANRVFSRSSISYNPNAQDALTPASATSTPTSHAPTPVSASFGGGAHKESASGTQTPTSTTAATKGPKKGKKTAAAAAAAAAAAGVEDSETDGSREPKRSRTHFGAGRKGQS
ncbi:hypothetical protein VTK73DRAFT_8408 [Phialemonium thermophilum]|uniref:Chromatin modification-related protein EAF6 n=1 Tax=Phialemonium thermophilum TaxID=223376 RepID=A0ABR3W8Z4_9PEZI